jgi:hypothetical protein
MYLHLFDHQFSKERKETHSMLAMSRLLKISSGIENDEVRLKNDFIGAFHAIFLTPTLTLLVNALVQQSPSSDV